MPNDLDDVVAKAKALMKQYAESDLRFFTRVYIEKGAPLSGETSYERRRAALRDVLDDLNRSQS